MMFIDSNIWCYYLNNQVPQHKQVVVFLEKAIHKHQLCVSTVVLMEVSHYVFKTLGSQMGKECMNDLLELPLSIIDFTYPVLQESLEIFSRHLHTGIGGRDASMLAAMKQQEVKELVTHDQAFKKITDIQVIDPIRS